MYDYKTVRRWTMEKRLKMWGQVWTLMLILFLTLMLP